MPLPKNSMTLAEIDRLFDVDAVAGKVYWKKSPESKGRAIICLETEKRFRTGREASTFFRVAPSAISNRARLGVVLKFADDRVEAGYRTVKYIQIEVGGTTVYAHRLIWAKHTGKWPKDQIDHINTDGFDNRIANLREVTAAQNAQKLRRGKNPPSKSGFKWVRKVVWPTGKAWRAEVYCDNKQYRGPYRNAPRLAYRDAVALAQKLHGEFFLP